MSSDTELVLILAAMHLLMIACAIVLFAPLLRGEEFPFRLRGEDEEDDGGGGNDRVAPRNPGGPRGGGLPLPDAAQAAVRLRGPARLADVLGRRERRPAHPPRPQRDPVRPTPARLR